VKTKLLIPGIQHAEETDLRAEVSRIACNFKKGFDTGAKQKIVDGLLVLQSEWRQPIMMQNVLSSATRKR
jgi:hypothetical protein